MSVLSLPRFDWKRPVAEQVDADVLAELVYIGDMIVAIGANKPEAIPLKNQLRVACAKYFANHNDAEDSVLREARQRAGI